MSKSLADALKKRRQLEKGEIWADEITILSDMSSGFKLYLGSGRDAQNLDQLKAHGVTYILNVSDDVPNFHEKHADAGLVYKKLNVGDFGTDAGISRVFADAIVFVKEAMAVPTNVLVHCANGSNRSPTVVLALAMNLKKVSLLVAWRAVKKDRQSVFPLKDNRNEIVEYEKYLHGKNSVQQGKLNFVPLEDEKI